MSWSIWEYSRNRQDLVVYRVDVCPLLPGLAPACRQVHSPTAGTKEGVDLGLEGLKSAFLKKYMLYLIKNTLEIHSQI